jgi:hypothetical protein
MAKVTVQVDRPGEPPEQVMLELSLETLTMRESVRLEELVGPAVFADVAAGDTKALSRPTVIRAIIYTKLKSERPDVELEAFDLDLTELAEAFTSEENESPKGPASAGSSSE